VPQTAAVPQTAVVSPEPLLETVETAGVLLAQSRSSVYRLIREGRLHAVKVRGSTRIPREAVEQLVAELVAEGAPINEDPAAGQATRSSDIPAGRGRDAIPA